VPARRPSFFTFTCINFEGVGIARVIPAWKNSSQEHGQGAPAARFSSDSTPGNMASLDFLSDRLMPVSFLQKVAAL